MPGTQVTDAFAPVLADDDYDVGETAEDWVAVRHPADVGVELVTDTIDTHATITIDVEIQGADDDQGTNPVSYGRFSNIAHGDNGIRRLLNARIYKPYARAVVTVADPGSEGVTEATLAVRLVQPHLRRTVNTTA